MSKKTRKIKSKKQKKQVKKYGKKIIKFGNGLSVDVTDMMSSVNAFDMKFGIIPRSKKKALEHEPKALYKVHNERLQTFMAFMVAAVNGMDIKQIYKPGKIGQKRKKLEITPEEFRNNSCLEWRNPKTKFDIKKNTFKRRFVCLNLLQMKKMVKPIIERKWKYNRANVCEEEWRYFYLTKLSKDVTKFCINVLNAKKYKNSLLKLLLDMNYGVPDAKAKLQNRTILDYIRSMEYIKKDPLTRKPLLTEDAGMILITRAALCLACNSVNTKKLYTLKKIEGADATEDMEEILRRLGKSIIREQKKYGISPMFRAFNDSHPLIYTTYYKEANEDKCLNMGIRACVFVAFIWNDKEIYHLVNKFINYYPPRDSVI